jgi:hypothetical protein
MVHLVIMHLINGAGGGGGAGAVGGNATWNCFTRTSGWCWRSWSFKFNIHGSPVSYRAGGGGGGGGDTRWKYGGSWWRWSMGGTQAPANASTGGTGTVNTGGGGGGAGYLPLYAGGSVNGGPGIVIIRYKYQ